jgi:phosphoglucosamine mutase
MAKYFGTDGIRGRFGIELNAPLAFKVAQSLKGVLNVDKVVIGIDTRESSTELMYACASGAQSIGVDVMLAGVVSTPLISHYSKEKQIAGIMITASHNPYKDNGIKVFNRGNKLTEEQELAVEAFVDGNRDFEVERVGKIYSGEAVIDEYATLIDSLDLPYVDLKVGYDSANGANYMLSKGIFDGLTRDSIQIGNKPDGKNINEGVGSTHLESIIQLVKDEQCDIGLSFDGDGDRILVVDHDGTVIDGDALIYVLAVYLKEQGRLNKNKVVLTKMSNLGIIKAFERQGISVEIVNVGDKYVLEKLNEQHLSIGGENSGHVILREFINTGDGLLVGAYLLKVLQETKQTLSQLTSDIQMWPQELVNLRTFNKEIIKDERVVSLVNSIKEELGDNGKIFVRASGTEPLLRVTVSCEKQEDLNRYRDQVVGLLNRIKEEV